MRKFILWLCLSLLFYEWGTAQKLVKKAVLNPKTQFVQIIGDNCFHIRVDTHPGELVEVRASIEGEYAKDLAVRIEDQGQHLMISAGFLPNFILPNDKLSAHKVISIALQITIPEHLMTSIYGSTTNVTASGNYKLLNISLLDGSCTLGKISGDITVKTQKGEIKAFDAQGDVTLKSDYGEVFKGNIPEGHQTYSLHSIEGNIEVNHSNG